MDNNSFNPFQPQPTTPSPSMPPVQPVTPIQPIAPITPTPIASGPQLATPPVSPSVPTPKNPARRALIDTFVLIGVCLVAAAAVVFAVIFFLQSNEAQANFDSKINAAVATAKEEQQQLDQATYEEEAKLPNVEFTGPSDYGSLSFMHPKTWSVYVAKDARTGGDFEAYLNPAQVNPVAEETINALRVYIYDRPIEQVRDQYDSLVTSGDLSSRVYTVGDLTGTIYEGAFSESITGIALMIKIDDKTAVLRADAALFRKDFEKLIATLKTN